MSVDNYSRVERIATSMASDPLFLGDHSPVPSGAMNPRWYLGNRDKGNQDDAKFKSNITTHPLEKDEDKHSRSSSRERILPALPAEARYQFRTYILRGLLNSLGPPLILAIYIFIVYFYLILPTPGGIVVHHPISARVVFYGWLVLSAFILGWAKTGIAGFEAAALQQPSMAPANAAKFLWHSDRIWAEVTGWSRALVAMGRYIKGVATRRRNVEWDGPSWLWFYLASSSILLNIAVPLAGLSIEFSTAFRLTDRPVNILGTNETSFHSRPSDTLSELAQARWRLGNPTTPQGETILYAPEGTPDVSDTYFEDAIQDNYQKNLQNTSNPLNQTISFFSGPAVTERVYGRAWGILNDLACTPVHPYDYGGGLKLLNATGVVNWTYTGPETNTTSQAFFPGDHYVFQPGFETNPLQGRIMTSPKMLGVTYSYVIAHNYLALDYLYPSTPELPKHGLLELLVWQTYDESSGDVPDDNFNHHLSTHPLVTSSLNPFDNLTYLGYGISCSILTTTGQATLSALTNTYSSFTPQPPTPANSGNLRGNIMQYPGTQFIHSLVWSAFTTQTLALVMSPKCDVALNPSCDGWAATNDATGGVPVHFPARLEEGFNERFQPPSIGPERMVLGMQKLFGEVAVAVMSAGSGSGNWTSSDRGGNTNVNVSELERGLWGLETAPGIVGGIVPYVYPLVVLAVWVVVTVVPQVRPGILLGRRWAPVLDGVTLFRLGAEWTGHVHRMQSSELLDLGGTSLREVPGMIGDMNGDGGGRTVEASGFEYKGAGAGDLKMRMMTGEGDGDEGGKEFGFVGLSTQVARADKGRLYTLKRR